MIGLCLVCVMIVAMHHDIAGTGVHPFKARLFLDRFAESDDSE
jgi:hypothetical protein